MMRGRPRRDPFNGLIDSVTIVRGALVAEFVPGTTPEQVERTLGRFVRQSVRQRPVPEPPVEPEPPVPEPEPPVPEPEPVPEPPVEPPVEPEPPVRP